MKKLLALSSTLAIAAGLVLIGSGLWAMIFTYKNVAQEQIVTPEDAALSHMPVRGPLTLKAQADAIRKHTLAMTNGRTYSQMSRDDEQRNVWVTAMTLTTALHLAIMTYLFSGLVILLGCISVWTGVIFAALSKQYKK